MEEKDIQLLDDFFNDLLKEDERQAVLDRAAADPEFVAEFALRREMSEWPRRETARQALRENLESIGAAFFDAPAEEQAPPAMKAHVNWRRWMLAAAAAVLLGVAVWFISRPEPALYRQYARYAPPAFTERGAAEEAATAAENAFKAGRFEACLSALDRLLTAQPGNPTATLYKGICLLELDRPAEARRVLEPLVLGRSALRADAVWYSALSYLLENNHAACKIGLQVLIPGDDHYEEAQKLIRQLE